MILNKQIKKTLLTASLLAGMYQTRAQCTIPSNVTATPSVVCAGATSSLNATSVGSSIQWYTVPVGGVPFGTSASGANFTVSALNTTTYYAEAFVAGTSTLNYTGAIQTVTIPAGVSSITIDARGAQGGGSNGGGGGLGARMVGTYTVTPGMVLSVVVPSMGLLQVGGNVQNSSGGGGGAFVYLAGGSPTLLVAAGGGGGKCNYTGSGPLHPGAAGTVAANGNASSDGAGTGGVGGNGGGAGMWAGSPCSGGGTGWSANGGGPYGGLGLVTWAGGPGYCAGGGGGCGGVGGFGGGGGGGNLYGGGGGGGGYSGGGGGTDPTHGGGGGSFSSGLAQSNTSGFQSGNGQVIISGLVACVSASRTAVVLTVSPSPTITITGGTVACSGNTLNLTANGANTYSWSNGAVTSTIAVSPTVNTTYSVIGTSTLAGCTGTVSQLITIGSTPTVAVAGPTAAVCAGSSVSLIASGAATYSWSNGAATSSIAPTPTANASYTVIGTSTAGCSGSAVTAVTVTAAPSVSVTGAGTICVNQSATLTASGANTYSWNTGATTSSIVVSPTVNTTYTAMGTSSVTGCTGIISANVVVSPCTGLNQFGVQSSDLRVYPNPSNGEFTVELKNGLNKIIDVTDLTGRIVLTGTTMKDKMNINISHLANGVYYVKVQSNNAVEVIKIVKQ